jgi:hypothetical protein
MTQVSLKDLSRATSCHKRTVWTMSLLFSACRRKLAALRASALSNQATLGERQRSGSGNDDVIEHTHID